MDRRLVQCPDVAAYQSLAHSEDSLIPILGSRSDDRDLARALGMELIELADAGQYRAPETPAAMVSPPPRPPDGHVGYDCVLARLDAYLPFAKALAHWTSRELVLWDNNFTTLPSLRARSTVIIGTPDAFPFSFLVQVAALTARVASPEMGIITGRSAAAVSRRVARAAFSLDRGAGRTLRLGALTAKEVTTAAPDSKKEAVDLYCPIGALITISHGNSIDMDLGVAVLCGRATHAGEPAGFPCRLDQGCRRSPKGEEQLVHVGHLDAQVIFAESCNAIAIADGLYPEDVSLALNILEGPAAFIGTCKLIRSSQGQLACLASALLASGYSFGAVTSIVNRAQAELVADHPSYLLIGDPRRRLATEVAPLRLTVDCQGPSSALAFDIDCGDREARVVEIAIAVEREVAKSIAGRALRVELVPGLSPQESGVGLLLGAEEPEARFFLCMDAARRFTRVRVSFERERFPTPHWVAATLWQSIEMLWAIREGVATSPAKSSSSERCLQELDAILNRARQMAIFAEQIQGTYHPRSVGFNGLLSSYQLLLEDVSNLNRELVSRFPNWGLSAHLAWAYGKRLSPDGPERPSGTCHICGCPCFELDYASPRVPLLRRNIRHCPRCGILSDCPAGARPVGWRGPAAIVAGSNADFELLAQNDRTVPVEIAASTVFPHVPHPFECRFTPNLTNVTIAPESQSLVALRLESADSTPPGNYSVVLAAASMLALQVVALPLCVRPATPR
jgi:hypothetical protein